MNDDLISRKALLDRFRYGDKESESDKAWICAVRRMIKEQTTAFDKGRAIEQLHRCRVYQFQGTLPDGRVCHFSDVIEIVEKGGIE